MKLSGTHQVVLRLCYEETFQAREPLGLDNDDKDGTDIMMNMVMLRKTHSKPGTFQAWEASWPQRPQSPERGVRFVRHPTYTWGTYILSQSFWKSGKDVPLN